MSPYKNDFADKWISLSDSNEWLSAITGSSLWGGKNPFQGYLDLPSTYDEADLDFEMCVYFIVLNILGKKVPLNHTRKVVVFINMLHKKSTWSYCSSKYVRPKIQ